MLGAALEDPLVAMTVAATHTPSALATVAIASVGEERAGGAIIASVNWELAWREEVDIVIAELVDIVIAEDDEDDAECSDQGCERYQQRTKGRPEGGEKAEGSLDPLFFCSKKGGPNLYGDLCTRATSCDQPSNLRGWSQI